MEIALVNHIGHRLSFLTKNADVAMGLATMCILLVMLIPVPTFLLDLLLTFNITLSLMILLVGLYVQKPLDFSAFPSILLLSTLFRLSLNISSTRMILLHGNEGVSAAGNVIMAFGGFVVGGNYVVGLIVFIILVVINFAVITKGAGRIAEVAARFTLDALPGKQMSIDADLNAGLIDEEQARDRRRLISRESEYYGSMDGANKFVRGDAIAGIIITLINILAGFAIGVFQHGMTFTDAAANYTLLTIGDGLVSQVPALIISTAAGIIVTRAGAESDLGFEIGSQLLTRPRALAVAAVILILFAMVPGLPFFPFMLLALIIGGIAYYGFKTQAEKKSNEANTENQKNIVEEKSSKEEEFKSLPPMDMLGLEIGYGLIPLVDAEQNGELLDRVKSIRRQIAQDLGFVAPSIHIQDNMQLKPGEYAIKLKGNEVARGDLMLNHYLAMNPGTADPALRGILTKEPTYGLDAYWINERSREDAIAKGYTVVDHATIMTTHISDVVRRYAHELIGRQEAQHLLDALKQNYPKVVEELVPNHLSLGGVVKVLQNLLMEQVSIRDLLTIVETLADWAPSTRQLDVLTEYVRQSLSRSITSQYLSSDGNLMVVTLGPSAERRMAESIQRSEHGDFLTVDPQYAQKLMRRLADRMEKFTPLNLQPILICSAQIRYHFKKMADRFLPHLVVLSYEEIAPTIKIQSLGVVETTDED